VDTQHQIRSNPKNPQESTPPKPQKTRPLPDTEARRTSGKSPSAPSFSPNHTLSPTHQHPISQRSGNPDLSGINIADPDSSGVNNQSSIANAPDPLSTPAYALYLSSALYKSDFLCKTNPIPKTPKPTQPFATQRLTRRNHPYPTRKNKPNQTQFITAQPPGEAGSEACACDAIYFPLTIEDRQSTK